MSEEEMKKRIDELESALRCLREMIETKSVYSYNAGLHLIRRLLKDAIT